MSKNIVRLPEEIKQEFSIDSNGKAYASQRATARLAGVSQEAVRKLLLKLSDNLKASEIFEAYLGQDFKGDKLPDTLVALIIEYYAFEAGRYCTEQAKLVFRSFAAIGFRTWAQQELGWQSESTLSIEEAIALANLASESAQNAGVDKSVSEQIKLEGLMKMYPDSEHLIKPQQEAIAANNPMSEKPMTPTEVGQELAVRLGYPKISAKKVNSKLLELGYQVSVTRIKKSTGKEVHDYYQPTEKGKPHSTLLLSLYVDGEGKATKAQLRWFSSIVSILANNWRTRVLTHPLHREMSVEDTHE